MDEKVGRLMISDHTCQEKSKLAKYIVKMAALGKCFLNELLYGLLKQIM